MSEFPLGIFDSWVIREWRVRYNMFHFKFQYRGNAINFCVKYNIPLKNEYFYGIGRVYIPSPGAIFYE